MTLPDGRVTAFTSCQQRIKEKQTQLQLVVACICLSLDTIIFDG